MPQPIDSLADRAARHFPTQACVAGFKLLHDGRVAIERVSGSSADATVRGKRARSVRLRTDETTLWVACTCWPTSVEASACKHVWASLLALDRDARLPRGHGGPLRLASLPDARNAPHAGDDAPEPRAAAQGEGESAGRAVAAPRVTRATTHGGPKLKAAKTGGAKSTPAKTGGAKSTPAKTGGAKSTPAKTGGAKRTATRPASASARSR